MTSLPTAPTSADPKLTKGSHRHGVIDVGQLSELPEVAFSHPRTSARTVILSRLFTL
jgi:hypothetical protein